MRSPLKPPVVDAQSNQPQQSINLSSVLAACPENQRQIWQCLHRLLDEAYDHHAHEVHLEPDDDCWRIRFRSSFSFSETRVDSIDDYQCILSLLKDRLWDSIDKKTTYRGWFEFVVKEAEWLLQLDIVPSARGETCMITFLRPSKTPPPRLDALALNRKQQAKIRSSINHANGLVLVASDLKQSRVQTARALVQEIVAPDKKIVCADSPGHPLLPRTTQLTVDTPPSSEQLHAWTAMCQLGCDAIVSCQSLDDETDRQNIRYASKKTLVIQCLEAYHAADAVDRMLSKGVRSEALARTLTAIIVQRQVQCICRYCRRSQVPDDDSTAWLAEHNPIKAGNINDWLRHRMRSSFSQADGCEKCNDTGHGNILDIYDIVSIDDAIRDALYDTDIPYALSMLRENTALSTHLLNLAQEGIISLAEAVRVAPLNASND